MTGPRRRPLEIVLRKGKSVAVIIDIREYRELLERLADIEDLEDIRAGLREYEQGKTIPWEEVKKEFDEGE